MMNISKFKLLKNEIEILKKMLFKSFYLINILNNGICLIQNINNMSNLNIFIHKDKFEIFESNEKINFILFDINDLHDLEIYKSNKSYQSKKKIKFVKKSLNIYEKLNNYKFLKTDIKYNHVEKNKKLSFLNDCNFEILISEDINGIALKTKKNNYELYINLVYDSI